MQQVTRNLKRGDEAVAAGGVASESAAAIPSGQQRWRTRRNGGSVSAAVSVWAGKQARSFSCLVQFGQMQTPRVALPLAARAPFGAAALALAAAIALRVRVEETRAPPSRRRGPRLQFRGDIRRPSSRGSSEGGALRQLEGREMTPQLGGCSGRHTHVRAKFD